MGCQQSTGLKGDASGGNRAVPPVPSDSWYAQPFGEVTPMIMNSYHFDNRGEVVFSDVLLPATKEQLDSHPIPKDVPNQVRFSLDSGNIFGMGYLFNTALYIEHHWRLRVAHTPVIPERFSRPFYNMLLGAKVFIDDQLVPDTGAFEDSLPGCTTTCRANEATTTWICLPLVFIGNLEHRLLKNMRLYRPMMMSFLSKAKDLTPGDHAVRVEIVYGCKAENNFCTEFISTGAFTLNVTESGKARAAALYDECSALHQVSPTTEKRYVPCPTPLNNKPIPTCATCSKPRDLTCTVCGANVCGSLQCVYTTVTGYPFGCRSHAAVVQK